MKMDSVISYLINQGVFCDDLSYKQITTGASGAIIYFVTDSSGRYVLKVSRKSESTDPDVLAAFAREYALYNLNKSVTLFFIPKTIYSEESIEYGFILVMERFDSIPHSSWDSDSQRKAVDLCARLNSLDVSLFEELELNRDVIEIDPKETETSYNLWLEVIRQHKGRFDEKMLKEIYENLDVVCPVLNSEPLRVCHGDFHPDNLISDGKQFYIIDWQSLHIGKSAGDISFFINRGKGFGIQMDAGELFAYYAERLSEYTGEDISVENLMLEDSASVLFSTFMYWPYYLKNASDERVEIFFKQMLEAYHDIRMKTGI